jgi:hypothetical protein
MKKSELLHTLLTELRRHSFGAFWTEQPSMANGGPGVIVPGCPACKKQLFTMANFMDHLANDVLPAALDKLSTAPDNKSDAATDQTDHSAADQSAV